MQETYFIIFILLANGCRKKHLIRKIIKVWKNRRAFKSRGAGYLTVQTAAQGTTISILLKLLTPFFLKAKVNAYNKSSLKYNINLIFILQSQRNN